MKLITWNVAGFRKENSKNAWDYSEFDYGYFTENINKYSPDVICFQESLFIDSLDQVEHVAKLLNYDFLSTKVSPDHTIEGSFLGMGILSKKKIDNFEEVVLPYPDFPLFFPDGREAKKFDKYAQIASVGGFKIVNLQLQPIHYWGFNYYEEPGYSYGRNVSGVVNTYLDEKSIVCGDLQISHLEVPFADIMVRFKDALPNEFTRIRENGKNTKSDHVLVPKDLKVIGSEIVKTQTDHFMCFAEI